MLNQNCKRNEFRESGARNIDNKKVGTPASILKPVFKAGSR